MENELLADLVEQVEDDLVGLWELAWQCERAKPPITWPEMESVVLRVARRALMTGEIVAGMPGVEFTDDCTSAAIAALTSAGTLKGKARGKWYIGMARGVVPMSVLEVAIRRELDRAGVVALELSQLLRDLVSTGAIADADTGLSAVASGLREGRLTAGEFRFRVWPGTVDEVIDCIAAE